MFELTDSGFPSTQSSKNFLFDCHTLLLSVSSNMLSIFKDTLHAIQLLFLIVLTSLYIAEVHLDCSFAAVAELLVLRYPWISSISCGGRQYHSVVLVTKNIPDKIL
jgi:hypothetical protein